MLAGDTSWLLEKRLEKNLDGGSSAGILRHSPSTFSPYYEKKFHETNNDGNNSTLTWMELYLEEYTRDLIEHNLHLLISET
ncbi:Hypothetical predicted protein [Octopus vulgaris]|uniref:Uncharacterized protein n=1 Tax=Octopus vulgaris TaxID=6645 RepID=A0AA36FKA7_OCTVU|nr:Hypothetical predicted protein [Octopus vulgaris]